MDQLFRVDRVARERGLTLEARQALRNEESKPILERIKVSIEATRLGGLPQSARTKACEYTLKLWGRLTRFLDHPELELSNNATENSMRPVAIGRNRQNHPKLSAKCVAYASTPVIGWKHFSMTWRMSCAIRFRSFCS